MLRYLLIPNANTPGTEEIKKQINIVFQNVDWEFVFQDRSVDSMFNWLKSILSHSIDQYVPLIPIHPRQKLQSLPKPLSTERKTTWLAYKQSRTFYDRQSQQAKHALKKIPRPKLHLP